MSGMTNRRTLALLAPVAMAAGALALTATPAGAEPSVSVYFACPAGVPVVGYAPGNGDSVARWIGQLGADRPSADGTMSLLEGRLMEARTTWQLVPGTRAVWYPTDTDAPIRVVPSDLCAAESGEVPPTTTPTTEPTTTPTSSPPVVPLGHVACPADELPQLRFTSTGTGILHVELGTRQGPAALDVAPDADGSWGLTPGLTASTADHELDVLTATLPGGEPVELTSSCYRQPVVTVPTPTTTVTVVDTVPTTVPQDVQVSAAETSTVSIATPMVVAAPASLPMTGRHIGAEALGGAALIAAGALALWQGTRRKLAPLRADLERQGRRQPRRWDY